MHVHTTYMKSSKSPGHAEHREAWRPERKPVGRRMEMLPRAETLGWRGSRKGFLTQVSVVRTSSGMS